MEDEKERYRAELHESQQREHDLEDMNDELSYSAQELRAQRKRATEELQTAQEHCVCFRSLCFS